MPRLVLTQALVDSPTLMPGDYRDLTLPNFGLRVGKTRRVFYIRIRERGQRIRLMLGLAGDPLHGRLRLREARRQAAERLGLHAEGAVLKPPLGAATGLLHPETVTVAQLVTAFVTEHEGRWSKSHRSASRSFAAMLTRQFGPSLVRGINRHQLKLLIRTYASQAPINANRLQAFISTLCRWAVNEELLERNPIIGLDKPTRERSRERTLEAHELRTFWAALDAVTANPTSTRRTRAYADLARMRLLTAQREHSLRQLEWSMVDLEAKTIAFPAALMKMARPHVVPLGDRAWKILEHRRAAAHVVDRFVFGSRLGAGQAPAPTRGLRIGLPDFRGHDLRRTAATLMSQHGILRFDVARVLAHQDGSITAVYDRYDYLSEKRRALETLDRVITSILEPTPATSTVVPFVREQ